MSFFTFLALCALVVSFIASIALLVVAFRESPAWGFACMFVPFAAFVFVFKHWDKAKEPFLTSIIASAVFYGGLFYEGPPDWKNLFTRTAVKEESRKRERSYEALTPPPAPVTLSDRLETPRPKEAARDVVAQAQQPPSLEQVYADNESMMYWTTECTSRPATAYRVPKSVVVQQGYEQAACN